MNVTIAKHLVSFAVQVAVRSGARDMDGKVGSAERTENCTEIYVSLGILLFNFAVLNISHTA